MTPRILSRLISVALVLAAATSALGYIHFPPMTMPKMCKQSTNIRLLSVQKHSKENGIVIYEVVETLKGEKPGGEKTRPKSFKHVIRKDADGVKPIIDWLANGKQALLLTIEAGGLACGYVFIDEFCYSVDYNRKGDYWLLIRADPQMSACFHGPAELLRQVTKDLLDGKDVKVPVKEPASPPSKEERAKEVTEILKKNRAN